MSYGAEVIDSAGRTIFDSEHAAETIIYRVLTTTSTNLSNASNSSGNNYSGGHSPVVNLPDTLFGWDNHLAYPTPFYRTNYSSVPQVTAPSGSSVNYNHYSSLDLTGRVIMPYNSGWDNLVGARIIYGQSGQIVASYFAKMYTSDLGYFRGSAIAGIITNDSTGVEDYSQAYVVWEMRGNVSAMSNTSGSRYIQYVSTKKVTPTIWVRPTSNSFQGTFSTLSGRDGSFQNHEEVSAYDHTEHEWTNLPTTSFRYDEAVMIFTDQVGTHQFEIVVTVSCNDWGTATNSSKYAAGGSTTHGLEVYTEGGQKHHVSSTPEQWITYTTLSRPAKVYSTKGLGPAAINTFPAHTMINTSAALTPNKNYCRMNGTARGELYQVGGTFSGYTYKWFSNHRIKCKWKALSFYGLASGTYVQSTPLAFAGTYHNEQMFAIADFGEGM
jgi:hypothetical protein